MSKVILKRTIRQVASYGIAKFFVICCKTARPLLFQAVISAV